MQRGLQLNLEVTDDTAAFFRVYQHEGQNQTALVLLNKGDSATTTDAQAWLFDADWVDAGSNEKLTGSKVEVPAHGVRVIVTDAPFRAADYREKLADLHRTARRD